MAKLKTTVFRHFFFWQTRSGNNNKNASKPQGVIGTEYYSISFFFLYEKLAIMLALMPVSCVFVDPAIAGLFPDNEQDKIVQHVLTLAAPLFFTWRIIWGWFAICKRHAGSRAFDERIILRWSGEAMSSFFPEKPIETNFEAQAARILRYVWNNNGSSGWPRRKGGKILPICNGT